MRFAVTHSFTLCLIIAAFLGSPASGGGSLSAATGRIVDQRVRASPGEELSIQLESGGHLEIRGTEADSAHVRVRLPRGSWRNVAVTFQAVAGGVRLHAAAVDHSLATAGAVFQVEVPRRYNIALQSAGGRLTITDVEGVFRGSVSGGMITIERAQGRAELTTRGGAIRLSDSDLSGSITTGGGSVLVQRVTGGVHAAFDPAAARGVAECDLTRK